MSYTKTQWNNDQAPAINASNLNKIEQGIFDNDAGIINLLQEIGINTNTWVSTDTYSLNDVVVYNKKLYKNITGNYTTTNPSDDTTNWNEIQIINSNGKLDKSLIPYFNNSKSNATDEGYSCDYINKCNTYSTTEVDTGKKWIDGKPIYRIVIIQDNVADGTNILTNVDKIVSINGMGDPGTGALRNLPYYEYYNNQKYSCRFEMITNTLTLDSMLGGSSHSARLIVVIEYTKTTD